LRDRPDFSTLRQKSMRKIYTALPQAVEPCPSPNEARMEKNVGYRYKKLLYETCRHVWSAFNQSRCPNRSRQTMNDPSKNDNQTGNERQW